MKIFKKLSSLFTFEDGLDLSRRKFIKDAGSLAALTVAALNAPSLLKVKELQAQILEGRVYGQTFYLTEPIIIDLPNVVIDNCTFIAVNPMPYMLKMTENANHCAIQNCMFQSDNLADTAFYFEARTDDMTNTIQAAIDAGSGIDAVIVIPRGEHRLSSPLLLLAGNKIKG